MKHLLNKPYIVLWIMMPLVLAMGVAYSDSALDINIHDTYLVIYGIHLSIFICCLCFFLGLGYWLMLKMNKRLYKWLTFIHLFLSVIGGVMIWGASVYASNEMIQSDKALWDNLELSHIILTLGFFSILLGQLFYSMNILLTLIRNRHD